MARNQVGELVREWRVRRRRSQLGLALDAGVSARHLSFVETGRSRPSPELVLLLADHLEVPLRERNTLLVAAGYAPRFPETALDDAAMGRVLASLRRLLDAHDPFPGVVVDRAWNVVLANGAAQRMVAGLPPELLGPPLNLFRASLHPEGLAARTTNLNEWAAYLVGELRRAAAVNPGDATLADLRDEVLAYPSAVGVNSLEPPGTGEEPTLLLPVRLAADGGELSMFTTMTRFSTPTDITLAELAVELFFPADEASEALLRGAGPGPTFRDV